MPLCEGRLCEFMYACCFLEMNVTHWGGGEQYASNLEKQMKSNLSLKQNSRVINVEFYKAWAFVYLAYKNGDEHYIYDYYSRILCPDYEFL